MMDGYPPDDIEFADEYPGCATVDEQRRAFVMAHLANPEMEGRSLIATFEMALRWLKNGEVPPEKPAPRGKADLSVVKP